MRLTLRTMLAYLDDILEPDDTADIGKKIEESEFATNLVHRTRDVVRRLRLGVPPLIGRGLAADPNTVAEYLDNTLLADRVPEFEKICLESDVHLAEVASCHQVLTLVLGEPATIEPESRQRMYRLATHVEAPPVQNDAVRQAGPAAATSAVAPPITRRFKPEVPEYLRESRSRSRFWPVAATIVIVALLTCGGLMVLGPAEWRDRATAMFAGAPDDANREAPLDAAPVASGQQPASDSDAGTASEPIGAEGESSESPDVAGTIAPAPVIPPTRTLPDTADAPPAPEPKQGDDEPAAPGAADSPARPDRVASLPTTAEIGAPVPGAGDSSKKDMPAEDIRAEDGGKVRVDDGGVAPGKSGASAPAAENFGRYQSHQRDVLLKFDVASGAWKRLAPMSPLAKGDRLLSLPSFRPTITLTSNVTIQADGPALLELVGWTDQAVPIVAIEFGRFLMMTVGKPGNSLQLKLEDHEPQLTFVDANATLAVDVRRVLGPGKNPEEAPAPLAADVYATSGSIRVSHGDAPVEIQAPARRALLSAGTDVVSGNEFPKWVTVDVLPEIDRQAAVVVEPLLAPDKPVALVLRELAEDRRREVRSLAARSLSYLGDFEACEKELNESRFKALWPVYVDELRAAVARGPQTAALVRTAFEKQRGADAPGLYRMLWGYSTEDLKNGADRDLVEGLDHDSIDYRVLSFYNLKAITGATHFYQPEAPTMKRRTTVAAWKTKLKDGKIVPRSAAGPTRSKSADAAKSGS